MRPNDVLCKLRSMRILIRNFNRMNGKFLNCKVSCKRCTYKDIRSVNLLQFAGRPFACVFHEFKYINNPLSIFRGDLCRKYCDVLLVLV